jgi:hypothetical protein
MAVLVEAISVIVRRRAIDAKFPGGWAAFAADAPNRTLCSDGEIARVGFMSPADVETYVQSLEKLGLTHTEGEKAIDLAVLDQMRGPAVPVDWLEFGHVELTRTGGKVAACRLTGSRVASIMLPEGWEYEGSLSQTYGFIPAGEVDKSLEFLRHENGMDVFLNRLTGKEVYIGRTGEA